MTSYLLDTNVLSEVMKRRPAECVMDRLRAVPAENLFTSSICAMELRHGAARRQDDGALWRRIRGEVLSRVRVLPLGEDEAFRAGDLLATLEARGQPIGVEDLLIAATALTHGLVLSTRNVKHLARVPDLRVEDWWRESEPAG